MLGHHSSLTHSGLTRSSLDYVIRIGFAIEFPHLIKGLPAGGHGRLVY